MKSGRQRRPEIQIRRVGKPAALRAEEARAHAKREAKARAAQLKGQVVANPANLRPTNSYSTPDFVARGFYVDMPFACKACGQAQVWTAAQQKWWYESAKGDVWTIAVLCRPCRLGERKRKSAARDVHVAGLAKKAPREP
jgi:hypothetical protein